MDRNEEYKALLRELDQTPPELEYTVTRAKARAKRSRARRWFGVPAGTLAGVLQTGVVVVGELPGAVLILGKQLQVFLQTEHLPPDHQRGADV